MKRYRRKSIPVEAQQWFPGVEILGMENVLCYYQVGSSGYGSMNWKLWIKPSYWVIHHQNGDFEAITNEEFQSKYEKIA